MMVALIYLCKELPWDELLCHQSLRVKHTVVGRSQECFLNELKLSIVRKVLSLLYET